MNEVAFNNLLRQIEILNDDFKAFAEKFRTNFRSGYTSLEYQNSLHKAFLTANDGERNIKLSPETIGLPQPVPDFITECFSIAKKNRVSFKKCFRKRFYSCYYNEIAERLYSKLYHKMLGTMRQTDKGMAKRFEKDYSETGNVFRLIKESGSVLDLTELDLFAETGYTLSLPLAVSENESFRISAFIFDIKENVFIDNPYIFKDDEKNAVAYFLKQQGYTVQELADGINRGIYSSDFIEQLVYIFNNADTAKELQLRLLVTLDKDGTETLDSFTGTEKAVIENAMLVLAEDGRETEMIYPEHSFDIPISMIKLPKGE